MGPRMGRPSWDEYFMTIAYHVAGRATCVRGNVGAVLVRDRNILSTGYNGAPRGLPHCSEVGCDLRQTVGVNGIVEDNCRRVLHAEVNAVIQAARNGVAILPGASIYITHSPCPECLKVLLNVGITTVYYGKAYKLINIERLVKESGVKLVCLGQPQEGGQ